MTNFNNEFDYSKTYYKVLRKDMTHNGFKYEMGLNVDTNEFNDNPKESCVKGGLYFVDNEHIAQFICWGEYLAEITIPKESKIIKLGNLKYRTDRFIIEKIIPININTLDAIILNNPNYPKETILKDLVFKKRFSLAKDFLSKYDLSRDPIYISILYRIMKFAINMNSIEIKNFVIENLGYFRYHEPNMFSLDYNFLINYRDEGRYKQINFIYDNNL